VRCCQGTAAAARRRAARAWRDGKAGVSPCQKQRAFDDNQWAPKATHSDRNGLSLVENNETGGFSLFRRCSTLCSHAVFHAVFPRSVPTLRSHAVFPRSVPTLRSHAALPRCVPRWRKQTAGWPKALTLPLVCARESTTAAVMTAPNNKMVRIKIRLGSMQGKGESSPFPTSHAPRRTLSEDRGEVGRGSRRMRAAAGAVVVVG
jgi:hypothetical protein